MAKAKQETGTIALGDKTYTIEALDLDTLEKIGDEIGALANPSLGANIGAMKRILAAATGASVEEIGKAKATLAQLKHAAEALSRVTGLDELKKERAAAEAAAKK